MKLTRFKLAFLSYALFDLLIGGHCGGLLPLGEIAAAQTTPAIGNITSAGSTCSTTSIPTNCVVLQLDTATSAATIQVTGTYSATNQFEVSGDNQATWSNVSCTPPNSATAVSSTTSTGLWQCNVAGYTHVRARASAYTSGTAAVVINSAHAVPSIVTGGIGGTGAGSTNVQGAGASGATTVGNPVLFGCAFETTPTTVSTGQTNSFHCDSSGRPLVVGAFTVGTASAASLGGMPMLCDSATSGTVTAGQAQMVRCTTLGVLSAGLSIGALDATGYNGGGLVGSNASALAPVVLPELVSTGTTLYSRQYMCDKTAKLNALAAATTQIVAAVASQKIYVCNIVISNNNATATTLKAVEGTGSNCGTGTADLSALMNIGATTTSPISIQFGANAGWVTATAADALCFTSSAASSLEITISYVQHN